MALKRISALFDTIDDVEVYLELRPYRIEDDVCIFILKLSVKNDYISTNGLFALATSTGIFEDTFDNSTKKIENIFKSLYGFLNEDTENSKKRVYMIRDMILANQALIIPLKLEDETENKYFFTRLERNAPI